ncbi:YraN family protein, partial [bacterium]|nr:YraN family protein [bacterium]
RRNLRSKAGEIDLLMWDGDILVIVEVRSVRSMEGFTAEDKIPPAKRRQLIRLATSLFPHLPDPQPDLRFDVCVVEFEPEIRIEHLPDAFRATDYQRRCR